MLARLEDRPIENGDRVGAAPHFLEGDGLGEGGIHGRRTLKTFVLLDRGQHARPVLLGGAHPGLENVDLDLAGVEPLHPAEERLDHVERPEAQSVVGAAKVDPHQERARFPGSRVRGGDPLHPLDFGRGGTGAAREAQPCGEIVQELHIVGRQRGLGLLIPFRCGGRGRGQGRDGRG